MKEIEIIQYYLVPRPTWNMLGATSRSRCDQLFEHSVLKVKEIHFLKNETHTHTHTGRERERERERERLLF